MSKRFAYIAAVQAGYAKELAWIKNNGETNTRMTHSERSKRKARN